MLDERDALLSNAATRARAYLTTLGDRSVAALPADRARLAELNTPFPARSTSPAIVLEQLDRLGSPATTAIAGGRFFGYVCGGTLPAALAASWLAAAWDQDAGMSSVCPINATVEEVVRRWLIDLFGLPPETGVGFVTGGTMANFSALAAARHHVLSQVGWDVERDGLFGAPPVSVYVSDEVHVSVIKALGMLGFGRERVTRLPVDDQGRILASNLPMMLGPSIVCTQVGNVNTGASDPVAAICDWAHEAGAWVHVDGAFGLWAAASPSHKHLVDGVSRADSWATDAHKWLNVPYDSGIALVRNSETLRAAMAATAAYLETTSFREPDQFTPEMSRRARGIEVWAALASLGRSGLQDLIDRTCNYAVRFASGLRDAGCDILNDVELNQVLVSFGSPEVTRQVIADLQSDGTCWCGGTVWQGRTAMRISVSSWATSEQDVAISLDAVLRIAARVRQEAG
ncbi:aminotransferase class V-fold PLP-dependent enzyme [soil metagenome]